jgi:hypothetical protein
MTQPDIFRLGTFRSGPKLGPSSFLLYGPPASSFPFLASSIAGRVGGASESYQDADLCENSDGQDHYPRGGEQ